MSKAMRDMPAWGISLVINLSILAAFNYIVLESQKDLDSTTITSVVDDKLQEEELRFNETAMDQVGTDGTGVSMSPSLQVATAVADKAESREEEFDEVFNPELRDFASESIDHTSEDLAQEFDNKGTSDKVEGGVEGALDRAAYEIRNSLRSRKTMVIWLFDASGSLDERREAVANRFDNIYKQVGETGDTDSLYTVIASFGAKANLHTPEPLQDPAKLSEIVRKEIKKDESGKEMVFSAAKLTLEKFQNWHRSKGPWNKLVFIITDEKGDDADQYLENVITLGKRTNTRFFTIGNAAIFGQLKGYVEYTYEDGYVDYLPVDQGPESAFPDAVQLPFIGSGQDWKLKQMSSSYGPYALTRLCAETGGMYLITEETRGYNFDRAVMRRYAPDYRPVRVIKQEIAKNGAKRALVNVAEMTYRSSSPIPELTFRGYNDNILRTDITEAQKPVAEIDYELKRLYDGLSTGTKDRDSLREPRWQAAFDLAMGRILAMRVRYFGYNTMLANMRVTPKSFSSEKNNMWRLVPSDEILTGPEMRKAAASAKEYLKRVIDDHPGTPWAMLATRELEMDLGWSWEEYSEAIPGSNGMLRANQEEVARLLLADEERREVARQKAAKPRARPKL
ncbi:vWA domain-containing protein [Thalassoglobus polymorphus]|uniref:VWFA domain-containing protein n=1 Tax=Thalassoglobus polymorphus TaxID=2527994 RepID=A0A517QJE9_9PLAN|nr:vWA domain-containing protein [Thalassoglobus polymorphus]QDT31770.1 hypothetical protein Mal48_10060 [Thalassoglobus polymorphus]